MIWGPVMEDVTATIRGLINDLTRTLTASIVHLDDLLLELSANSEEYDDAYLADQQLGRALEFFFEMRSLFLMSQGENNIEHIAHNDTFILNKMSHMFNNALTVIFGCCDLMQIENVCNETQETIKMIYDVGERTKLFMANSRNTMNNAKKKYIPPNIIHFNNSEIEMPNKKRLIDKNIKILLVEDEHDVRTFIGSILEKRGYEIIAAATGEKALEILENHADIINIALVDVKLPGISGRDLVDQIIFRNRDIKILFTSGYYDERSEDMVNESYRILKKPFHLSDLFGELDNLCKDVT